MQVGKNERFTKDAEELVKYILPLIQKTNDKERNFVYQIEGDISWGKNITERQVKWLEQIYRKVTGAGDFIERQRF
jgi:hypothetical protein